ncbi:LLM class flavin-dependent oxidoreductase [Dactylosporangium sucinum]|nr:LLM class flavin-dependent oxidoreductase [Dactylosporangium sucinum]
MRFGVNALPQTTVWDDYRELCLRTEALGYSSFWTYDHLVSRTSSGPGPTLECLTSLAALAPLTSRITLGSLVLASEFRHPSLVAKAASTLALVTGGRFALGISAGSNPLEHAMFGIPYPAAGERVGRFASSASIIRSLLHGGTVSLRDGIFELDNARLIPGTPPPKIAIGARGPRMLRLVRDLADIHVSAATPGELRILNRDLDALCERGGRPPASIERAVIVYEACGRTAAATAVKRAALETLFGRPFADLENRVLCGGKDQLAQRLGEYREAGADHLFVSAVPPYDHDFLEYFVTDVAATATSP